ncbi:hypothetical protein HK102_009130, partial [Quaeritorhiza haematococci]
DTNKYPAVLLIAGSGPIDADGVARAPLQPALPLNIQKLLAEEFSGRMGFVGLRFDKRGVAKSASKADKNLFWKAGIDELVDDIIGAYKYLAEHKRVRKDRIILVGHSEGCMLIPAVNAKLSNNPELASLPPIFAGILLSGLGDSLIEATAYQRKLLGDEIKTAKGFQGFILRLVFGKNPHAALESKAQKQFEEFRSSKEDFKSSFFGLVKTPVKWWRQHLNYLVPGKLQEDYGKIQFHVFGATGEYDIQTDPAWLDKDLRALIPQAASIEAHRVPQVSHLLRHCKKPNTFVNMKQEYPAQCKQPLSPELMGMIG